jgi:hypothetical protein
MPSDLKLWPFPDPCKNSFVCFGKKPKICYPSRYNIAVIHVHSRRHEVPFFYNVNTVKNKHLDRSEACIRKKLKEMITVDICSQTKQE